MPELSRTSLSSLMVSHAQSTQDAGIVSWAAQQADTEVKNPLLRTIISLAGMSGAEKGHMNKPCPVPPSCQEIPAAGWHLGSGESCIPPGSWREQALQSSPLYTTAIMSQGFEVTADSHLDTPQPGFPEQPGTDIPRPCNIKML